MRNSVSVNILWVGIIVALLIGASCIRIPRPYQVPTTKEVITALQLRGGRLNTLRAEMRIRHQAPQGKIKATVRLMAQQGNKLRYDVVSPFDTPLATLVTNGKDFVLIDAQKNRHFFGPASPCNIARLTQVAILPDDVIKILAGSTPLIQFQQASLSWDDMAGAEVLTLVGKEVKQTIRLNGNHRSWDLQLSEVINARGEILLKIEASDYRMINGLSVPQEIILSQPQNKAILGMTMKKEEINLTLPQEAFELMPAAGLPSQRVDCDTEIKIKP